MKDLKNPWNIRPIKNLKINSVSALILENTTSSCLDNTGRGRRRHHELGVTQCRGAPQQGRDQILAGQNRTLLRWVIINRNRGLF